jgi:HD-GYP domain-containing protein (c-di-GMP phosphodiesterase class II)
VTPLAPPPARDAAPDVKLSEVVSALSYALDITEGQPEGHAVRSCLIGMRLAGHLGLSPEQRSALFYALLMKDLGCSSNAARISALFGADDQALKRDFKTTDWARPAETLRYALRNAAPGAGPLVRVRKLLELRADEGGGTRGLIAIRCERGAQIAGHIGFSQATSEAIRALDEHWDGGGHPLGLAGEEIPLLARVLCLAQTLEVFFSAYGPEAARAVAAERRGRWFDPALVDAFLDVQAAPAFWEGLAGEALEQEVRALEPQGEVLLSDEVRLERVAEAFAQVIDAKSPWTYRHSDRVAKLAVGTAVVLGFSRTELRDLRRAALLHDIGKLGVSNRILDKPGRLTDAEFAEIRRHPEYTRRILARVAPFRGVAEVAGAHHERLDGRGYPQGLRADALPPAARVLAVADQFEALSSARPYRELLSRDAVFEILDKGVGTAIDGDCLDALKTFAGYMPEL